MLYPPMDVRSRRPTGGSSPGAGYVKGDPRDPFTLADCRALHGVGRADPPLPAADLERFVAMVERLEDVKDTATLMPLLGGPRRDERRDATMSDAPHVGFIGLGVVGGRMATTCRAGASAGRVDVDPAKTRGSRSGGRAARGVHHLDAPVSGGYREAERHARHHRRGRAQRVGAGEAGAGDAEVSGKASPAGMDVDTLPSGASAAVRAAPGRMIRSG